MSVQQWGTPELGVYFLRHAGHDLEVRRVPKTGKGANERQYQVIVNGIFTDMAWSTTEGKTKSVRYAERAHKGQPILPYNERARAADQQNEADAPAVAVSQSSGVLVLQPHDEQAPEVPELEAIPASSLINGFSQVPCGCAADLETRQVPVTVQDGVSFTISGNLTMDATDALVTIRAAVELLREHGLVDCDTIVPQRVKL